MRSFPLVRPKLLPLLICLIAVCCFASITQGQTYYVNGSTQRPIPGVGHNYIGMLAETVNPADGTLSVQVTIQPPKSRGLTLPFSIIYNSNNIHYPSGDSTTGIVSWLKLGDFITNGGWGVFPSQVHPRRRC